ncbi:MAG: hypothetical protein EA370_02745 [Wenzhouxiangella sp.]|nr:MAG: hypothetical protein EA370_02745 [Wenzhouxiangella sp.]
MHALFAVIFLFLSVSASASDHVWVRSHHVASAPAIAEFGLQSSLSDYGSMQWGGMKAAQAAEFEAADVRISIEANEGVSSSQFQRGGDIVRFTNIDFTPNSDFTGSAVQWFTGDTCNCDTGPFDFNPFRSPVQWYWPNQETQDAGGVSLDDGLSYAVLEPGAVIGPGSSFLVETTAFATLRWRQGDGVQGYLGFQFVNPDTGQTNYGYANISTTGSSGHPMTIHGWAFNRAGDPITVAPLGDEVFADRFQSY